MLKTIVLTVIGPDRPGLVETLSSTITEHGGNWTESRMARLPNQFTGMLLANVPEENLAALQKALSSLIDEGLHITVHDAAGESGGTTQRAIELELLGQDRAELRAPDELDTNELHALLEDIANEFMIDITLADQDPLTGKTHEHS